MKKSSKILSLVLVLVLLCSMFVLVACNKDEIEENATGAYILSDKATFLSFKRNKEGDKLPNLSILLESDENMQNTYSMIAVDGDGTGFTTPVILNEIGADCFIKWMSLASTRNLIKEYGKDIYGESLFYLFDDNKIIYTGEDYKYEGSGATNKVIKISTTTSVNDSGLLGFLEPKFEEATGFNLEIASAGTGAAIKAAKAGNADLLLVHSKTQEKDFIDGGFSRKVVGLNEGAEEESRISFMYNFFVLIGPNADPAKVKTATGAAEAFKSIKNGGYTFVSRGDNSGTQSKETSLWKLAGENGIYYDKGANTAVFPKEYNWYVSTGQGMGASLLVANNSITKK